MTGYRVEPKVDDQIQADGWSFPERLKDGDGYIDRSFPGCQFRYNPYGTDYKIAINIKVTGQPKLYGSMWASRCKIEFVGDGEPSTFVGGRLFSKHV